MQNEQQHLKVANHLEAMIASGLLTPGAKIPSLRKLGKEFNLSLGIVRRSIDYMREKGVLVAQHGSGVYVAENRNEKNLSNRSDTKYRIGVFITSEDLSNSYCAHALSGIQALAKDEYALTLHFHGYFNGQPISNALLEQVAAESDALLFLGCYDYILEKLPTTRPCIGLEIHNSYQGLMSTVAIDPLNIAEKACDFFSSRGYDRVKILFEENQNLHRPMPVYRFRRMVFADAWRDYGTIEEVGDSIPISLEHVADDKCAYFLASDTEYNRLAVAYREKFGSNLVDDRCILSVEGKAMLIPSYEPINTLAVDWKTMGKIAFEECIRRIENPGSSSRRIYQDCHLITRHSSEQSSPDK